MKRKNFRFWHQFQFCLVSNISFDFNFKKSSVFFCFCWCRFYIFVFECWVFVFVNDEKIVLPKKCLNHKTHKSFSWIRNCPKTNLIPAYLILVSTETKIGHTFRIFINWLANGNFLTHVGHLESLVIAFYIENKCSNKNFCASDVF